MAILKSKPEHVGDMHWHYDNRNIRPGRDVQLSLISHDVRDTLLPSLTFYKIPSYKANDLLFKNGLGKKDGFNSI